MSSRSGPDFLPIIRSDIRDILRRSEREFGEAASERYAALIQQALLDLHENPLRPGAKARPDLAANAFVYHLMFSRDRVPGERVKAILCSTGYAGIVVEFARILDESRDLAKHLAPSYSREGLPRK